MRIAILTSGGDAPGMNEAIRAATLAGASRGHSVLGIRRGYQGLLEGDAIPLEAATTDGITREGGTILGSSRSAEFPTAEGQAKARGRLRELGVAALVVIGETARSPERTSSRKITPRRSSVSRPRS